MNDINNFELSEIQNYTKKKYSNQFSLEKSSEFLISIQKGEVPLVEAMSKLRNNPEILNISYKGLSFLHYLVLNNNYSYVKYMLDVSLEVGLKELPLTGNVVASTKFTANQEFLDFLINQDCEESYLAVTSILSAIRSNHVPKTLVESAFKAQPKWIKFFKGVYGQERVEGCINNYFIKNPYQVIEPLKKLKDFDKLKSNLGIDVFKEIDGESILSKLLENPYYFRTLLNFFDKNLKNPKEKYGVYIFSEIEDFLINLAESESLITTTPINSNNAGKQEFKTVGEAVSELLKEVSLESVIDKFEKRIMDDERNLKSSMVRKSPQQKVLKF